MKPGSLKTGILGRADLLDAELAGGPELQGVLARLLGLEQLLPEPIVIPAEPAEVPESAAPVRKVSVPTYERRPITFWQADTYRSLTSTQLVPARSKKKQTVKINEPAVPLEFHPLAGPAAILTKLRRASAFSHTTGDIDIPRVVERLSRGGFPDTLPRRTRKTWGQSIHLLLDEHDHLNPYAEDRQFVISTLKQVYPKGSVELARLRDGSTEPRRLGTPRFARYLLPEPGTTVLALTDLGTLAVDRPSLPATWLKLGRLYREHDTRPVAMVPCDPAAIPAALKREWTIIPWEGSSSRRPGAVESEQICTRIINLLSYALRIEPVLIRELRRLLVKGQGAGLESRVWQDKKLRCQQYDAVEFHPELARELRAKFDQETPELRRAAIELLRRCHCEEYQVVWFLERLGLEAETDKLGDIDDDLIRAANWVQSQGDTLKGAERDPLSDLSLWFRRSFLRLSETSLKGTAGDALHEIFDLTRSVRDEPPTGLDLTRIPAEDKPIRTYELRQLGNELKAYPHEESLDLTNRRGSFISLIRARHGIVQVKPIDNFWLGGDPPPWADTWGWDSFGAWVTIRVGDLVQRMRWIRPGSFIMGSPDDDTESYPDEKPQHKREVAQGFWLFDTPCTQAFWEAVMGENPSRFKGHDRPVEQVSWNDCQTFVDRLKEKCHGLELALPSEAQWEYACCAGTETSRYSDNLDAIAWYGENSGDKTHPVAGKEPNVWGLYDTLGNVWEWCADTWTKDYSEKGRRPASSGRVIRGGSWNYNALLVRAACRNYYEPTYRRISIGCRLAEFKSGREPRMQAGAERARERGAGGAEPPGDRDQASAARALNLDSADKNSLLFHILPSISVHSDLESFTLQPLTKPPWATAIGRDKYGLWADFSIEKKIALPAKETPSKGWFSFGSKPKKSTPAPAPPAPVRQRLRWIPPGRFLMGSPKDEPGRWDWEQLPHEVVINEGFWMLATPCTQALWEAVTGENPSEFKSLDRPVEQVSWNQCQEFTTSLNLMVNEKIEDESRRLTLALPSEAQWEYACRAGTTDATYAGPIEILGQCNAPILDPIAWYAGNSGHEFDLAEGWDAGDWPEKQYDFKTAGTRLVGKKRANPWGLYDTLGNVWEWCADEWVHGGTGAASSVRVIRGGSWGNDARRVRAACRLNYEPTLRDDYIGCRLAEFRRGREQSEQSQQSEVSKASGSEVAERPETATRRTKRARKKK